MKKRESAIVSLSVLLILGLSLSATAFYFDFQYFETDKLVYEVGETVDMVARLIADFSPEGWCYVSFAAVTDLGPVFADEYFIPASPNPRMLNSSYTILPNDTNPGENGTTANVIFNVEIFDTVSQGAGDNIEISITRGHLTVKPVTPLIVQVDDNTTLSSKIVSVHNDSIVYVNEPINVQLDDPYDKTILDFNTTTNANGSFSFNWNSTMGFPGNYDLKVTGIGNEDFLGFTKHLSLAVVATASNLSLIEAPSSIECQSPDGSNYQHANITIKHEAADMTGISDSIIFWNSNFANGTMTNIGNGFYFVSIPFQVPPEVYSINITSSNPRYQNDTFILPIKAEVNLLYFYPVQTNLSVNHGNTSLLEFRIEDEFGWNNALTVQFSDSLGEILLYKTLFLNSSANLTLTAWYNLSIGIHTIIIDEVSEYYNFTGLQSFQFNVIGELYVNATIESAFYGEYLLVNLSVVNINENIIDPISIKVYFNNESQPFEEKLQVSSTELISITLPLRIQPGYQTLDFDISAPYFLPSLLNVNTTVMMRTNMTIVIESNNLKSLQAFSYHSDILSSISLGSIIRPPPILFNETTSVVSPTTRETSLDN